MELFRANTSIHTNPAFISTLASSVSAGATSFTVATGAGDVLPSPTGGDYFRLRIGTNAAPEVARITARSGDVCTCDALANNHTAGDDVIWTVSGETLEGLQASKGSVIVEIDYVTLTTTTNISSTNSASPTNIISGNAKTYDGSTRVKIEFYSPIISENTSSSVSFVLYDGSTAVGIIANIYASSGQINTPCKVDYILTPTAGSHTYHIKGYVASGSGTGNLFLGTGGASTAVGAYLRITNANSTVELPYATTTTPGIIKLGSGLAISSGIVTTKDYSGSAAYDFGSISNGSQASTTITATGAVVGDFVTHVSASASLSGLRLWGEVTATNTVTIYLSNMTGGSVDLASMTFYVGVSKR